MESDVTIANGFGENTSEREPSKSISALFEAGGAELETTVGGLGAGVEAPAVGAHTAGKDMKYVIQCEHSDQNTIPYLEIRYFNIF